MKKAVTIALVLAVLAMGCGHSGVLTDPNRYNTQRGAAIGAGLGALTGQIIGKDTESTLIGAGVGTMLGTIIGNYEDQRTETSK